MATSKVYRRKVRLEMGLLGTPVRKVPAHMRMQKEETKCVRNTMAWGAEGTGGRRMEITQI